MCLGWEAVRAPRTFTVCGNLRLHLLNSLQLFIVPGLLLNTQHNEPFVFFEITPGPYLLDADGGCANWSCRLFFRIRHVGFDVGDDTKSRLNGSNGRVLYLNLGWCVVPSPSLT